MHNSSEIKKNLSQFTTKIICIYLLLGLFNVKKKSCLSGVYSVQPTLPPTLLSLSLSLSPSLPLPLSLSPSLSLSLSRGDVPLSL